MVTLFIDNIQKESSWREIRKLFVECGKVEDVFLPNKERKDTNLKFGFVRYKNEMEANEAITKNNGRYHRGVKLLVQKAKFERKSNYESSKTNAKSTTAKAPAQNSGYRRQWRVDKRDGRSYKEVIEDAKTPQQPRKLKETRARSEEVPTVKTVEGIRCEENFDWLNRSIIAKSCTPLQRETLESLLFSEWPTIVKVREMGNYKFMITFMTTEDMEEALATEQERLLERFEEISRWSEFEVCETRRVWLEVRGIPPHAWCRENMEKIASLCGDLICVDKATEMKEILSEAKLLIDTSYMPFINDNVNLTVGDKGFVVHVREIRLTFPVGWYSGNTSERPGSSKEVESHRSESLNSSLRPWEQAEDFEESEHVEEENPINDALGTQDAINDLVDAGYSKEEINQVLGDIEGCKEAENIPNTSVSTEVGSPLIKDGRLVEVAVVNGFEERIDEGTQVLSITTSPLTENNMCVSQSFILSDKEEDQEAVDPSMVSKLTSRNGKRKGKKKNKKRRKPKPIVTAREQLNQAILRLTQGEYEEEFSESDQENLELEAQKTWDIGKKILLSAERPLEVINTIKDVLEDRRRKKRKGDGGA